MARTVRLVFPRLTVEQELWQRGLRVVAGVDEVGMGPLAGPVVAAAVVFPSARISDEIPLSFPQGIRDSKTLTAKSRERLEHAIRQVALGVGIGVVEVEGFDGFTIYQAGLRAMRLPLDQLPEVPE